MNSSIFNRKILFLIILTGILLRVVWSFLLSFHLELDEAYCASMMKKIPDSFFLAAPFRHFSFEAPALIFFPIYKITEDILLTARLGGLSFSLFTFFSFIYISAKLKKHFNPIVITLLLSLPSLPLLEWTSKFRSYSIEFVLFFLSVLVRNEIIKGIVVGVSFFVFPPALILLPCAIALDSMLKNEAIKITLRRWLSIKFIFGVLISSSPYILYNIYNFKIHNYGFKITGIPTVDDIISEAIWGRGIITQKCERIFKIYFPMLKHGKIESISNLFPSLLFIFSIPIAIRGLFTSLRERNLYLIIFFFCAILTIISAKSDRNLVLLFIPYIFIISYKPRRYELPFFAFVLLANILTYRSSDCSGIFSAFKDPQRDMQVKSFFCPDKWGDADTKTIKKYMEKNMIKVAVSDGDFTMVFNAHFFPELCAIPLIPSFFFLYDEFDKCKDMIKSSKKITYIITKRYKTYYTRIVEALKERNIEFQEKREAGMIIITPKTKEIIDFGNPATYCINHDRKYQRDLVRIIKELIEEIKSKTK